MQKQIASLLLFSLLIASLFLITSSETCKAQNGTQVSGIISSETTWINANSPYIITADLLIDENAKLFIEKGVEIKANGYYGIYLNSNATLHANGTQENPVIFSSNQVGKGSWKGILVHAGTEYSQIHLNYTTMTFADYAVGFTSSAGDRNNLVVTIDNCKLYSNKESIGLNTPYKVDNANVYVENSLITQNDFGINLQSPFFHSNLVLQNNSVIDNTVGICLDDGVHENSITTMQLNVVARNNIGIEIGESGLGLGSPVQISLNTIAQNNVGIFIKLYFLYQHGSMSINDNNIYSNIQYNVQVATDFGICKQYNAANNWWGTANTTVIDQTIYDFNDNLDFGTVTYSPVLTTLNPTPPTYVYATTGVGGSISPNGFTKLVYGDKQSFTITPDIDYHVATVYVNETAIGALSSYTIEKTTGATTISVLFAVDPTPTPFLTSTINTNTPTEPITPSPTVPEYSVIIILPILIAIAMVAVVTKSLSQK